MEIMMPRDVELIEYLTSFASAFDDHPKMQSALLGVKDNLRQATLIPTEPLGAFACLTAEEEAASFLYYTLLHKGYEIPDHGKLHQHDIKMRYLLFAVVLGSYFLDSIPGSIYVERDGNRPKTSHVLEDGEKEIFFEDPLAAIRVDGEIENSNSHDLTIEKTIDAVLKKEIPNGSNIKSHLKKLANRRNECLYGGFDKKFRFKTEAEMEHFKSNCENMIVCGFLIFNGKSCTPSMVKLVEQITKKFAS